MERNYPSIYLYGKGSKNIDEQAATVRIAFSRERDDRNRGERVDGEWACKIVRSSRKDWSSATNGPSVHSSIFLVAPDVIDVKHHRLVCKESVKAKNVTELTEADLGNLNSTEQNKAEFVNSGDSDALPQGPPSQFLLIRSLEPSVTEDVLAKGVTKLYKPGRRPSPTPNTSKKGSSKVASTTGDANLGAKEGSLRRVLLIRDRRTGESWRYGFAEFASVDVRGPELWDVMFY